MDKNLLKSFPKEIKDTLEILNSNGFEAYLVGGCVRDALMGQAPHDFDICTNALPSETKKIFDGYKVLETGIKHGTVTVIINHTPIEITTYRTESEYLNHRHPSEVKFVRDLKSDLKRRDFTMNSLYLSKNGEVIDLFCGADDIRSKTICSIGNPDTRFSEDALRILRALRFSSCLGFEIEKATKASIFKNKNLLSSISKERIRDEFFKLILGDNQKGVIFEFREIIFFIIPELKSLYEDRNDLLLKTLSAISYLPKNIEERLSLLFKNVENPNLKELRLSSKMIGFINAQICDIDLALSSDPSELRKYISKNGFEFFSSHISIQKAILKAENKDTSKLDEVLNLGAELFERGECISLRDLKMNGKVLMSLGFDDGKEIGKILEIMLTKVLDGEVKNEEETLLAFAKNIFYYTKGE